MSTILLLTLLLPGQTPPAAGAPTRPNSLVRRLEARDAVLGSLGPESLAVMRAYGDSAIFALGNCTPQTGKKLCKIDFSAMKDPRAVLRTIQKHGEPCAAWLAENHSLLVDPDCLDAYCRDPLEIVHDMTDLQQAAAALRASRRVVPRWLEQAAGNVSPPWAVGGGMVVIVLLLLYRRRSKATGNMGHPMP